MLVFEDANGKLRSLQEYEEALDYYKRKVIKFDFSDPGSIMHAIVVIELLDRVIAELTNGDPSIHTECRSGS